MACVTTIKSMIDSTHAGQSSSIAESTAHSLFRARDAMAILGVIAVLWIVPGVGAVVFAVLAMWSPRSDEAAIKALTLAWLASSLNPGIYSPSSAGLRWLVLAVALAGIAFRSGPGRITGSLNRYPMILVVVVAGVASGLASHLPGLGDSQIDWLRDWSDGASGVGIGP